MTKQTIKVIRTVYAIVLSISILIAALCLMAACVEIYRSGDQPFSSQAVAEHFAGIAFPVYLCIALIAGGFIVDPRLATDSSKRSTQKQYHLILRKLHENYQVNSEAVRALQRSRKLHRIISTSLLALGAVIFLIYGLNPHNYHQTEINTSMINAMWILLPCLAVPFGYAVFTAYHARRSIIKEVELVKQTIADGCPKAEPRTNVQPVKNHPQSIFRWCLLCLAVGILIYGFFAGGTADVLTKAVNICTECVGLG